MMIPGEWEGRPKAPTEPPPSATAMTPPDDRGGDASLAHRRPELPDRLWAAIIAAILLAAPWLVMWLREAAR
jgi:hypothetical protein